MHRVPLLALLADYSKAHANDKNEQQVCLRYIDFVEKHPNCFDRELAIGHVTGSAWIVDPTGTQVLLTHHRKLDAWFQLGGHADGETDVLAVALNEAKEESGLENIRPIAPAIFDIDIHRIPARKEVPEHDHFDVRFSFCAADPEKIILSEESIDLSWIPLAELESKTTEKSMLRMRKKWQAIQG